jgi:acyl carrier protein phosphodiesterase
MLMANRSLLPGRLNRILGLMVSEDWLCGYARIDRVGITLDRIAGRLSRRHCFKGAIAEVKAKYQELERDFSAFFPQLVAFVHQSNTKLK